MRASHIVRFWSRGPVQPSSPESGELMGRSAVRRELPLPEDLRGVGVSAVEASDLASGEPADLPDFDPALREVVVLPLVSLDPLPAGSGDLAADFRVRLPVGWGAASGSGLAAPESSRDRVDRAFELFPDPLPASEACFLRPDFLLGSIRVFSQ